MHTPLKLWHNDAKKHSAPTKMVGKSYFHPKTRNVYEVTGVTFDAERGLWMVVYERDARFKNGELPETNFVHTIEDFTREGRFVEIQK